VVLWLSYYSWFKLFVVNRLAVVNLPIHKLLEVLVVQVLETVKDSSQVSDHHVFSIASCFEVLEDSRSVVFGCHIIVVQL